jgi:hypothetical protein
VTPVAAGAMVSLGHPSVDADEDWLLVVRM